MRRKSWESLLLILMITLAACGTADTPEIALNDTGVERATVEPTATATSEVTAEVAIEPVRDQEAKEPPTAQTNIDIDAFLATPQTPFITATAIYTLEYDVHATFLGWNEPNQSAFIRIEEDLYIVDLPTKQQTLIAANGYNLLDIPGTKDKLIVQADIKNLSYTVPTTLAYWSDVDQQLTTFYTDTFEALNSRALYWVGEDLISSPSFRGEIQQISLKQQSTTLLKTAPLTYQNYERKQYVLAPNGTHSLIFGDDPVIPRNRHISLFEKDAEIAKLIVTPNRTYPQWSPQGSYFTIAPTRNVNQLDIYSNQGNLLISFQARGELDMMTWNKDERLLTFGYTTQSITGTSASFIYDLQANALAQLPHPEVKEMSSHFVRLTTEDYLVPRNHTYTTSPQKEFASVITFYKLTR